MIRLESISIPLTVPEHQHATYLQNYLAATCNSGRLFLFAGDQKVEHLNHDFYGENIDQADASPEHLFNIASAGRIGVFATQLGMIARYASSYKNIPYLVKLNGKTDLLPTTQADPVSQCWTTVQQVVDFKNNSGLDILGVGMTVYLGSEHEAHMLTAAAQTVIEAHANGLLVVLWMYPRGKAVENEKSPDIIAGAAGVAMCLGADFAKINPPLAADGFESATLLKQATLAAGNTKVICSGGPQKNEDALLQDLYHQIHVGGACGTALGRNIHQKSLEAAIKLCNAVAAIVIDDVDVSTAKKLLE